MPYWTEAELDVASPAVLQAELDARIAAERAADDAAREPDHVAEAWAVWDAQSGDAASDDAADIF